MKNIFYKGQKNIYNKIAQMFVIQVLDNCKLFWYDAGGTFMFFSFDFMSVWFDLELKLQ